MISGSGSTSALAVFIIDGGSDSDVNCGYALSGDAEHKIRSMLKAHRMNLDDFYRTALIKERINAKHPKQNFPLATDEYKRILIDEINTISPNVVVPLSEVSFQFLTGISDIRKFRGSILNISPHCGVKKSTTRVIPTLGPNPYLYEDPKLEFISRLDIGKVIRNLHNTDPLREYGTVWVARSGEAFREFVSRHYNNSKFLTFDIETYANVPTCISFSFDGQESCTVPILDRDLSLDTRVILLQQVAKILKSDIPKGNQNVKFDWRKLERWGLKVNNVKYDTMLGQNLLYCEFPKNLGFLTSIYTDMPYFKDEGKDFNPESNKRDTLYLYCAKDSLATHQICSAQIEELKEQGVQQVYDNLISILPIYKEMEETGILVDDTARRRLLSEYENLYQIYKYKLQRLVGREVNPLSSVVMGKLVFEELGYRAIRGVKFTKSGNPSTDEESLEILLWRGDCRSLDGNAILKTIIDCRKLHKVLEVLVLDTDVDGRMKCEFNLAGAETGRTTSSESSDYYVYFDKGKVKMGNLGHSFQTFGKHGFTVDGITFGKNLRDIFIPSPGYCFIECDLSQAEARVDAVLACDFDILPVFDSPSGIHRLTGSWVFDCPADEIKKNTLVLNDQGTGEDRYHLSKTIRHAYERNMQAERLMMMIHKPENECATILKKLNGRQPNIREVFHKEVREAVRKRLLVAPNGRRRDFFGRFDEHQVNEGISFLPQAIVTDYLKAALPAVHQINREFYRPLAEAHDGFLSEVKIGHEHEYAKRFIETVQVPIDFRTCTLSREFQLVIPAEAEVSYTSWSEMKGLRI